MFHLAGSAIVHRTELQPIGSCERRGSVAVTMNVSHENQPATLKSPLAAPRDAPCQQFGTFACRSR